MRITLTLLSILLLGACAPLSYQAQLIESNPRANTKDHTIEYQNLHKELFNEQGISFDNQFDASRMNSCKRKNDSTFTIDILPENYPINASPWYAFRIISRIKQTVWIELNYQMAKHRYIPKVSSDRKNWKATPIEAIRMSRGDSTALFMVNLQTDTTWVAAQEIVNMHDTYKWASDLADDFDIEMKEYGKSKLGRPLYMLDIYNSRRTKKKPIIVITGRQHPPEITGYFAMQAFMEKILDASKQDKKFLKKYHILFYPIVNPDGVDLGNWRHNAGGIDLNRDWGSYHQPEIRQICDHIVTQSKKNKAEVMLGLDFHSTQKDIFYTNNPSLSEIESVPVKPHGRAALPGGLTKTWLSALDHTLSETLIIEPSGTRPVSTSKTWFTEELGAEGIIYEVGDQTDRSYITEKAHIAASLLMEILLNL